MPLLLGSLRRSVLGPRNSFGASVHLLDIVEVSCQTKWSFEGRERQISASVNSARELSI